jgi:LemA protein
VSPIAITLGVLLLYAALAFNRAVRLRNLLREGWSDIDVQLKKRHDLVPRLVECTKGYEKHERESLQKVVLARNLARTDQPSMALVESEETLNRALVDVLMIVESYPALKADVVFGDLMKSLVTVEESLEMARRYYSGAVRTYNTFIESFPQNLWTKALGFKTGEYFEISSVLERLNPAVKL